MRIIIHCVLILAFAILLKNVYCDSSNPLPNSPLNYLSSLPKQKARRPPTPPRRPPPPSPPPRAPPPSPQATSYILAVQWPPGVCSGESGVTCQITPVPTEFKIHGLWPKPEGASSSEVFDAGHLTPILTELNKNWPNLKSAQLQVILNIEFWKSEWLKHGKYSGLGVREYYEKSLQLLKDFGGLKAKLAAEKITPTIFKTYKLAAIEAALKKINGGFSCTVICNERKHSKKKQIQEIRFRYTKDFKMQNNDVPSSTCGTATTDVMFPHAIKLFS